MRCWKVRARLVAFRDGELSPGEAHLVREHLADCTRCRLLDRRLEDVTPRFELHVSPYVQVRLYDRINGPVLRDLASRLPDPPAEPALPLLDWLRRDAGFSMGAVLACALLAMALGWSLGHLSSTASTRLASERDPAVGVVEAAPHRELLPADQYRPAAYTPADDASYH